MALLRMAPFNDVPESTGLPFDFNGTLSASSFTSGSAPIIKLLFILNVAEMEKILLDFSGNGAMSYCLLFLV